MNKIVKILVILGLIAIAIVGIIFMSKGKNKSSIEYYTGKASKEFEDRFIKDYKEMKKFSREITLSALKKDYQDFNANELFNEEYFDTKKLAIISIYEDNTAVYEYHIDKIIYNADRTLVTIEYTNKNSGYGGSLSSSWVNCMILELDSTVNDVNFIEITE